MKEEKKGNHMNKTVQLAIEKHYDINIKGCTAAPRGFVATTYFLEDQNGKRYFCKVIDKPDFIPGIVDSLPIVEEMHNNGIDRICYPIRGIDGLYHFVDDTLIVLYNHIPASQSFDYDLNTFGKLIAEIHSVTIKDTSVASKERLDSPLPKLFSERIENILSSQSADAVILEFKKLLMTHEEELRQNLAEYIRLKKLCPQKDLSLVITHGDVPTNILVKSPTDIYIIDWDELLLAPAERDLWMMDEYPEFMAGYKNIRPNFTINPTLRSYYILQYYFERIMHYAYEILNDSNDIDHRLKCIQKLSEGRMAGWRLPKVEQTQQ